MSIAGNKGQFIDDGKKPSAENMSVSCHLGLNGLIMITDDANEKKNASSRFRGADAVAVGEARIVCETCDVVDRVDGDCCR